jgi:catechol 2,3-dioxygenase-like lactoylglutathione lyase family enzyme
MSMARPDQRAELKFVVTNTLIVEDIQRSVAFYRDVLGATSEAHLERRRPAAVAPCGILHVLFGLWRWRRRDAAAPR